MTRLLVDIAEFAATASPAIRSPDIRSNSRRILRRRRESIFVRLHAHGNHLTLDLFLILFGLGHRLELRKRAAAGDAVALAAAASVLAHGWQLLQRLDCACLRLAVLVDGGQASDWRSAASWEAGWQRLHGWRGKLGQVRAGDRLRLWHRWESFSDRGLVDRLRRLALEKFHTVFDTAWPQTPEEVLSLAENLQEFTVVPDISTAEEYGRYIIRESGHFEVDPNLEDSIDYQSYGERRVREDGGLFGDRGYVAYLGTKPEMNEIMARNIPAERMEQGPQMGGLGDDHIKSGPRGQL